MPSDPTITTNIHGTKALETVGENISFYSESTGKAVYFNAFIMAFNESYNSDWASEKVFGRTDPIKLFKDTERRVTLSFKIPAASQREALENLNKLQTLIQFLYPHYDTQVSETSGRAYANNITSSPLVRLRVVNFLSKAIGMNVQDADKANAKNGLLGTISNFTVAYNFEAQTAVIEDKERGILPTAIDINLDFSVLHEKTLGWNKKNEFIGGANFPYNVDELEYSNRAMDALEKQQAGFDPNVAWMEVPAGRGIDGDGSHNGEENPRVPGKDPSQAVLEMVPDLNFVEGVNVDTGFSPGIDFEARTKTMNRAIRWAGESRRWWIPGKSVSWQENNE
jgi:hypothetical protein